MEFVSNVSGVVISNINGIVIAVFAIIFIAIAILLPVWAYLAQKYSHDCRREIREFKKLLQTIQTENKLRDDSRSDKE